MEASSIGEVSVSRRTALGAVGGVAILGSAFALGVAPANAALKTFKQWLSDVDGQLIDHDEVPVGMKYQCQDLWIDFAIKVVGVPKSMTPTWAGGASPHSGHACNVYHNAIAAGLGQYFTVLDADAEARPGDVAFWERFGIYQGSHVAIVTEDLGTELRLMSQNASAGSSPTGYVTLPKRTLLGYLRPRTLDLGTTPGPQASLGLAVGAVADKVFYADKDGSVRNAWWDAEVGNWSDSRLVATAIKARADSPFVSDGAASQVFFVTADHRIANLYHSGGDWQARYLSGSDTKVQAGSGLALANGKVYFISAAGSLHNAYWSDNRWNFAGVGNGSLKPRQGSPLAVNAASTQVFFFSTSNRLANAYYSGGWQLTHLTGDDVAVQAGSGLALAAGKLFFLKSDGSLHNAYYTDRWRFNGVTNAVTPRQGTAIVANQDASQVFFISAFGRLANAYYDAGWKATHLSGADQQVAAGSDLAHAGKHVFFVNAGNRLANAYYTDRWQFATIGGWPGS